MNKHWFLPQNPDVMETLRRQADITLAGVTAFVGWAGGDLGRQVEVRRYEHEADEVRRELSRQLREAFSTPIDAEDLFTLSERLDSVINGVKNIVRESESLDLAPDPPIAAMAEEIRQGVVHLRAAFDHLQGDGDHATHEADEAIGSERRMEKIYRKAMRDLVAIDDLREVVSRREFYRRTLEVGERLAGVADRVWYAVVKES